MSLALSTLIYEWRRYTAAIVALAFSGLLVLAQVGMFSGIGRAFTAAIDRSRADIMVLAPKSESLINGGNGLPRRLMPQIYMNPEVVEVADLDGGGGLFQNEVKGDEKRKREFVQVTSVDPVPGAATLPVDYPESVREALLEPYAVAVDESALKRLGVKLGDKASLNGRTIRIKAILTGYPNMMQPQLVVSRGTLRLLDMASTGDRVGPLMVKISDPSRAEAVRDALNASSGGKYRAWTRGELADANEKQLLTGEAFIGIMLGFSVALGFLIGVGITWMTLRGAIFANIKEFASLRALGVSMGSLRRIVVELSFWVGVAGLGVTALLTAGVTRLAAMGGLPLAYPMWSVILVSILLLLIALLSGLLSLGVLKKSQPADLLR
ncbi:ABC transporter permease [Caulobacter sp. 17J65-9]|uniref:ABC transporter permease n=1 Tax=Caulobacter sp. 17J65-9 TaxID=2709382 RepID=UPI0013C6555B|nr:ABC transporter permease [Caulobacter sp. 17J65-9]NEX92315.1 ABC transporter permease [Caulobacter sp. 17J65-9]